MTIKRFTLRKLLVVLSLSVCLPAAFGQQAAELVGTVLDHSGALVPGATVEATNNATGIARPVLTNSVGEYRLAPLAPGSYTVKVTAQGFKTIVQRDLTLEVNQVARTDFTLEVGDVAQLTTVEAIAPVVSSENATLGQVIDNKKIIELPMDGRNYLDLARLTPGVSQAAGAAGGVFINGGGSQSASLMQLDGVDNYESAFGRPNILAGVDMIQEFKIQTAQFSAEQGRASIGQINVISKSGTNSFHGSLYEYHRNAAVAALNFFDLSRTQRKAAGLSEVPPYIRNQFGASVGGPIRKNKTFFFANYEGNLIRQVTRGVLTVPDSLLRAGNFSQRSTLVYDPLTLDPATNKRLPFAGNIIPMQRIDPVALNYFKFEPPPTSPGTFGNYTASIGATDNIHQVTGKVDHNFSASDTISGRYTFNRRNSLVPGFLGSVLFPGFAELQNFPAQNVSVRETHIVNARTVNEVLLGYNRFRQHRYHQHQGEDVASELGLADQSGIPVAQRIGGFPSLSVQGFAMPYEHPYAPVSQADNSFQVYDKLSHEFPRHSLKAGVEFTYKRSPLDFHSGDRGGYNFSPVYTTAAPLAPGGPENAFGDFLLGFPVSDSRAIGWPDNTSNYNWWSVFVQDDWRIHPNLTLNLGLRYELYSGIYERFDRFNTFCLSQQVFCRVGQNGIPRAGYPRDTNDFAPRVGFAWRMFGNNKTVLRGGYGVFYDYRISNTFFNMNQAPPWQFVDSRPNDPATPMLSFRNPFPGALPTAPTAADQLSGTAVAPYYHSGYVQQWSLGLQREITRDTVIDVAYVANRGISLTNSWENRGISLTNSWELSYVTPGLGSPIPRRYYPRYASIPFADNSGHDWFDSMQVRFERRFRSGFNFVSSYTWGHSLYLGSIPGTQNEAGGFRNPTNFASDKGPGPTDIRQRLVVSSVVELPFGKGKPFLSGASKALDVAVGGWQVSAIATFQTGDPVTPSLSFNNSNASGNRPDAIGNPNSNAPHTVNQWFNPSVFVNPPTLQQVLDSGQSPWRSQGNSGLGIIRGPGLNVWEISVAKQFPMPWEHHRLEFRTEFFNAFNHPNFADPNATLPVVANLTGRIFSTSVANRTIQFALRYEF
jgi:hypothetical protein